MQGVTHIACSDESNWSFGRYRSIALVTAQAEHFEAFTNELLALLKDSGINEFKWERLKTARDRFAAE